MQGHQLLILSCVFINTNLMSEQCLEISILLIQDRRLEMCRCSSAIMVPHVPCILYLATGELLEERSLGTCRRDIPQLGWFMM